MAVVLGRGSITMSFGAYCIAVICFVCTVCAYESKPGFADVNGETFRSLSRNVQPLNLDSDRNSAFMQIFKTSSKLSERETSYEDVVRHYGIHTSKFCLGSNAPLVICFSVVLSYMGYIIVALMMKPVSAEDYMNPTLKVLLNDKVFRDSIVPPKLRELYGQLEYGNTETILALQNMTADQLPHNSEKAQANQLFSSVI